MLDRPVKRKHRGRPLAAADPSNLFTGKLSWGNLEGGLLARGGARPAKPDLVWFQGKLLRCRYVAMLIFVLLGLLALALAFCVAFKLRLREGKRGGSSGYLYTLRESILTPAERSFFGVLSQIEMTGLVVAPKIRLADILDVERTAGYTSAFNRISSKHLDFLLMDATDFRPLLAIELDDSSHRAANRHARDLFVDSALQSAGLRLLRVRAQAYYRAKELEFSIASVLSSPIERVACSK